MTGAAFLGIDVDPERIKKRLKTGYCDFMVTTLDEALRILKNAIRKKENVSVGLVGNCADVIPELAERGVVPDILTDQTSAHDPLNGYVPNGMTFSEAVELRKNDPKAYQEKSLDAMARHVEGMLRLQKMGSVTFDYGNNIRTFAFPARREECLRLPRIRARLYSSVVLRRPRPIPLGGAFGRSIRHSYHRRSRSRTVSRESHSASLDRPGKEAHQVSGLARTHLLAGLRRARSIRPRHERSGKERQDQSPIVIGRDHLDCGSVASPFRETESMKDGSDAVADWPLLNALLNTAAGASWVSIHNGGGVGIGYSLHAGQVTVADGTDEMAKRIERVLTTDPGMGVIRHVDAGYDEAKEFAKKAGVKVPMAMK